jgi:large subunit ribosomal protein L18
MSTTRIQEQRLRRITRVRARINGTAERPRIAVHRSLSHISAQMIDDVTGKTLVAVHDRELSKEVRAGKKKIEIAEAVGQLLGTRAGEKGIKRAVFDRRDKKYHGRVRALALGARAAGLAF